GRCPYTPARIGKARNQGNSGMDKHGWQVVAGLLGLALVGCAFGLAATRGVLAQERNDRAVCPSEAAEPAVVREAAPASVVLGLPVPDAAQCAGGVYIIRTEHGFESLLSGGQPIRCTR
ncbi:hypothetical protein, partial [Stenotrophomonas sp. VV52]|uniref:hypothetical protein n=1 Tax=Stenotrophomonas sp. VV52 TaxID=2066958 RepID=UPI001C0EE8A8